MAYEEEDGFFVEDARFFVVPRDEAAFRVDDRLAVERDEAAFRVDDRLAVEREDDGFFVVDRLDARFVLDRAFVDRARFEAARFAVVRVAAGLADARAPGRSSAATRRASPSISVRRPRRSSRIPWSSSDSRTRVTARATSSTIWLPRSLDPSGSARSTALRTASTVSAGPEPFLSFAFLSFFFAMARV